MDGSGRCVFRSPPKHATVVPLFHRTFQDRPQRGFRSHPHVSNTHSAHTHRRLQRNNQQNGQQHQRRVRRHTRKSTTHQKSRAPPPRSSKFSHRIHCSILHTNMDPQHDRETLRCPRESASRYAVSHFYHLFVRLAMRKKLQLRGSGPCDTESQRILEQRPSACFGDIAHALCHHLSIVPNASILAQQQRRCVLGNTAPQAAKSPDSILSYSELANPSFRKLFSHKIKEGFDARERRASYYPNLNNQRREFGTMSRLARPARKARSAPSRPPPLPAMNWARIWRAGTRLVKR